MAFNIFQFDWIFIDTVVILLLIIFLASVKIFKERIRWRSTLSNIALDHSIFDKQSFDLIFESIIVRKISITVNNVLTSRNMLKPSILIIRSNTNKKLFKALIEGLVSYGFDVINIILKIKKPHNRDLFEKQIQEDSMHLISSILNFFKQRQFAINSSYLTIINHKSNLSYDSIISDENNAGMILINPKIKQFDQKNFSEIIGKKELLLKLFIIFSKKSKTFLTNNHIQEFLTCIADHATPKSHLWVLDNSKRSFKYYETILLGIIINIIESKILKS